MITLLAESSVDVQEAVASGVQDVVESVGENVAETRSNLSDLFDPIVQRLPTLVFTLVCFLIGMFAARVFLRLLRRALERSGMDAVVASFVMSIVKIVVYVLLVVILLSMLDVPMTSIIAVIASAGVAVGLAIQDSLSNVAGGFIVLLSKPFKAGDFVEINGTAGTVEAITILYTQLATPDNATVHIPNGVVAGGKITNYTEKGTRRLDLSFGISYQDHVEQARILILKEVRKSPEALQEPEAQVVVLSHDESAVILQLQVWVEAGDYLALQYRLMEGVKTAFDQNHITIPFPQVDIHMEQSA